MVPYKVLAEMSYNYFTIKKPHQCSLIHYCILYKVRDCFYFVLVTDLLFVSGRALTGVKPAFQKYR